MNVKICLPASKSISNRALVISAMTSPRVLPSNLSACDDTQAVIRALEAQKTVDIGAAGTAMRFLTAYFSQTSGSRTITGSERMKRRPIGILVDALRQLGADVAYAGAEGFPPLRIAGSRLRGGALTMRGDVSSQFISAVLMIGPQLEGGLRLSLAGNIASRPYIDMTLALMRTYGAQAQWTSESTIDVAPQPYRPTEFTVESDWSAASYWYEIVALSADDICVELPRLWAESLQGDSRVAEFFEPLGVKTSYTAEGVTLSKSERTCARLDLDLSNQPDLAQTMLATCCALGVPFRLSGLESLRIKETDRISAMQTELAKLGYDVGAEGDHAMHWSGQRVEPSTAPILTYDDHRMALSLAPLAAPLGRSISIDAPQVVTKSYPTFWDDLALAGYSLTRGEGTLTCKHTGGKGQ